MKKILFGVLFLVLFACEAKAQQPQSWMLRRYVCGTNPCTNTGNVLEASATLLPVSGSNQGGVVCNVITPPATGSVNPGGIKWDDPANTGRFCTWNDPGTGPIESAAPSNTKLYGLTITTTVTNQPNPSAESMIASFTRPLVVPVPPAPTGLQPTQ